MCPGEQGLYCNNAASLSLNSFRYISLAILQLETEQVSWWSVESLVAEILRFPCPGRVLFSFHFRPEHPDRAKDLVLHDINDLSFFLKMWPMNLFAIIESIHVALPATYFAFGCSNGYPSRHCLLSQILLCFGPRIQN